MITSTMPRTFAVGHFAIRITFENFMVKIRTVVFWITTPCSLRNEYEPEDRRSMFLQNIRVITLKNT